MGKLPVANYRGEAMHKVLSLHIKMASTYPVVQSSSSGSTVRSHTGRQADGSSFFLLWLSDELLALARQLFPPDNSMLDGVLLSCPALA